jgi:predicted tellurium resistance membrane protein TerC
MSLGEVKGPIELSTPEYVPLASHTLVLRTRRQVREELERLKARHSLLRRTLLPSLLCVGIGLFIMLHPEFEIFWICKVVVLYYWALAVIIPWLVVRKEKKRIGQQLL